MCSMFKQNLQVNNDNPNQNTPSVKQVAAKSLKRLCCDIKMGSQGLLLLMELKFLTMMTRPQNVTVACCYNFTVGRQL